MNAHEGRSTAESVWFAAFRCFGRRHRLSGEYCLVALELVGLEDPEISRNDAADP
jgi:hypothetical protein